MCPKVCGQVASPLSATGYHNNKLPSGGDLMEMKKKRCWAQWRGILARNPGNFASKMLLGANGKLADPKVSRTIK